MQNNKVLSYLGLSRKAGKLVVGFAASKEACLKGTAKFIAVASDISEKSFKEIKYFSGGKVTVQKIPFTIFEVSAAIGIKAGIVAVCDEGFANALTKLFESNKEEFTNAD